MLFAVRCAVDVFFYVDETQSVVTVGYTGPSGAWCPPKLTNPPPSNVPDLWTQDCSFSAVALARTSDPPNPWEPNPFSNYGQDVDVWAPFAGYNITNDDVKYCQAGDVDAVNCPYSTWRYKRMITGRSVQENGQSVYNAIGSDHAPAALVAGTAALMIEANPALRGNPRKIKAQLMAGSTKPSEFYRNPTGGRGFLNVPGALRIPALG
jgi:hypothetical protein